MSSPRPLTQPPPVSGATPVPRRAGFAGGLVAACHADLPGILATGLRGPVAGVLLPEILVAVLFVDLRDDVAGLLLGGALVEHVTGLAAVPALEQLHVEPGGFRRAVGHVVRRGQMVVRIPLLDEMAHPVGPIRGLAMEVVFVAQVPGHVREGGEPRDGVAVVEPLLLAVGLKRRGQDLAADEENDRNDHVLLTRVPQEPLVLPPVVDVESLQIEAGILDVVRASAAQGFRCSWKFFVGTTGWPQGRGSFRP